MERFEGDRVEDRQRLDEIGTMIGFLDDRGVLSDWSSRVRRRNGSTEWTVWLMGVPSHVATARSTHAYLAGACDVVLVRDGVADPRRRM